MARFHKMVDMRRSREEKKEEVEPMPIDDMPDVPYGLCISLTENELEKLDLEEECDVGDMIHLFCMARVTSVSKNATSDGCRCRVELSITDMAVENEDDEDEPD